MKVYKISWRTALACPTDYGMKIFPLQPCLKYFSVIFLKSFFKTYDLQFYQIMTTKNMVWKNFSF